MEMYSQQHRTDSTRTLTFMHLAFSSSRRALANVPLKTKLVAQPHVIDHFNSGFVRRREVRMFSAWPPNLRERTNNAICATVCSSAVPDQCIFMFIHMVKPQSHTHARARRHTNAHTLMRTNACTSEATDGTRARTRANTHKHNTHTHRHARTQARTHAGTHAHTHTHARTHARTQARVRALARTQASTHALTYSSSQSVRQY